MGAIRAWMLLLLVSTLNAGFLKQFAVLLLRHPLTTLLNY
jgi:hypothetical protein